LVNAARARRPPRVAALTMVRDEGDMLPRWLAYYGGQLGVENLTVLDDNSGDGSVDNLPCTVHRLPAEPVRQSWARARLNLVNAYSSELLESYDVVIFSDVDEFLIPDPACYDGLVDYLVENRERTVCAPIAVNVLHNPEIEPALDAGRPLLRQRRFVKFAPNMCKPLIKRIPVNWKAGGFHGIGAPFEIDRSLLMTHLKYYDVDAMRKVAEQRHKRYQQGRGHPVSAWPLTPDQLTSLLLSWVATPDAVDVLEFDPQEPDLTQVIRRETGMHRSVGNQMKAMESNPLRRLPDRFTTAI
jgi:hypothetical protein